MGKFKIYPERDVAEDLNGLGPHIGRAYTPKAIMDILRRAYGSIKKIVRDGDGNIIAIRYKKEDRLGSRFNVDRNGYRQLEDAISREWNRDLRKARYAKQ